jgi:AraC-like DNA-binding protein
MFRIDDPECYVPLERMHAFFDAISRSEIGPQFPALFASRYRLREIGNWGEFLATCPDLLSACHCSALPEAKLFTHEGVRIDVASATTKYCNWLVVPPSMAKTQTEQLALIMILDGLRMAGDPDYAPLEIHLTGNSLDGLEEVLPLDRSTVMFNQVEFGMIFPTGMLASSMRDDGMRSLGLDPMASLDETISKRIERVLDASQSSLVPTLEGIADMVGFSPRSLQRYLAQEGASFSSVVEQWRFKKALRHLSDARLSVLEIGQELRYGHSSDFVRAFRRWAGTTPQRYRDDLALHQ